ncbi:hypothetical protein KR009_007748, partial [Drosophila setifemur]
IVFLALVAFCHSAPLEPKESVPSAGLARPSPINPDVISEPKPEEKTVLLKEDSTLNRQKRNEVKKPDSVKAREGLQHDPHRAQVLPKLEDPKVHHQVTAKPDSVKAHEGTHHADHKVKREVIQKPASVRAHEGLQHDAHRDQVQVEDLHTHHQVPAKPVHEETQHGDHKVKRDTIQKPDSVKAHEGLQHDPHRALVQQKIAEPIAPEQDEKERHQRDIPVPTEVKEHEGDADNSKAHSAHHEEESKKISEPVTTEKDENVRQQRDIPVPTEVKEHSSHHDEEEGKKIADPITTSDGSTPKRPHPKPVAELFHQSPTTTSSIPAPEEDKA